MPPTLSCYESIYRDQIAQELRNDGYTQSEIDAVLPDVYIDPRDYESSLIEAFDAMEEQWGDPQDRKEHLHHG